MTQVNRPTAADIARVLRVGEIDPGQLVLDRFRAHELAGEPAATIDERCELMIRCASEIQAEILAGMDTGDPIELVERIEPTYRVRTVRLAELRVAEQIRSWRELDARQDAELDRQARERQPARGYLR